MMRGILSSQNKREKEVRNQLNEYLNEQREAAYYLKENLKEFKDSILKGEPKSVEKLQ